MANRWGNSGNSDTFFLFLSSKITVDSDCSHEIEKLLLLIKKAVTNLDSVLKSRDTTLLTKVHIVKGVVFPVQLSRSIVSTSLRPHGLQHARLFCPWDSPGKNTRVGIHPLLQGNLPNPGLPHCRQILYHLSHQESPSYNQLLLLLSHFSRVRLCETP